MRVLNVKYWCIIGCHLILKARKNAIQKHFTCEKKIWKNEPLTLFCIKGPLGNLRTLDPSPRKCLQRAPFGSQFLGTLRASKSPSIHKSLTPEVIRGPTSPQSEHRLNLRLETRREQSPCTCLVLPSADISLRRPLPEQPVCAWSALPLARGLLSWASLPGRACPEPTSALSLFLSVPFQGCKWLPMGRPWGEAAQPAGGPTFHSQVIIPQVVLSWGLCPFTLVKALPFEMWVHFMFADLFPLVFLFPT